MVRKDFINLNQGRAMFRHPGTPKITTKTTGLLTHFHATINENLYFADMK